MDFIAVVTAISFVILGAWSAMLPNFRARLGLPLFLMAWGAQTTFVSLGSSVRDEQTAFVYYSVSQLFLPLAALLILYYVAVNTNPQSCDANRRIHAIAKISAIMTAAITLAAVVLTVFLPSSLLTITQQGDVYVRQLGWLSNVILITPYMVGVSLGFLLLGWTRLEDPLERLLTSGLFLAWAGYLGRTMGQGLESQSYSLGWGADDAVVYVAMASFALIMIAALGLFMSAWKRLAMQKPQRTIAIVNLILPVLVVFGGTASWLMNQHEWLFTAGFMRLAATLVLLPALVLMALRRDSALLSDEPQARAKRIPVLAAVGTMLVAGIIAMASPEQPRELWGTYTLGLALASAIIIEGMSYFQIRDWLLGRSA